VDCAGIDVLQFLVGPLRNTPSSVDQSRATTDLTKNTFLQIPYKWIKQTKPLNLLNFEQKNNFLLIQQPKHIRPSHLLLIHTWGCVSEGTGQKLKQINFCTHYTKTCTTVEDLAWKRSWLHIHKKLKRFYHAGWLLGKSTSMRTSKGSPSLRASRTSLLLSSSTWKPQVRQWNCNRISFCY